jgi:hypothetical protein
MRSWVQIFKTTSYKMQVNVVYIKSKVIRLFSDPAEAGATYIRMSNEIYFYLIFIDKVINILDLK